MNQKLGKTAKQEIRTAMQGLSGSAASQQKKHLAELYGCSESYIYGLTEDMRRSTRKKRSDAGKRKFELVPGTDFYEVAALVVGGKLDPDQALLTAKANGHDNLPSLATTQRLFREEGINRKQLHTGRRNHRRFEADAPLALVQIDCTALKVRWKDIKTRRILRIEGIDKNHPQLDAGKIRVWQIMAVDDHSRRRFFRYVTTSHITSRHMVSFFAELCQEWGVPVAVYTDNGPEFMGFFAKAPTILNSIPAVRDTGGFEHKKHAPNNPQASGKVEVAHKWAEKMDRYIGLAIDKGINVTSDNLDGFSHSLCRNYNEVHVHRTTGQTPMARWHGTLVTRRTLSAAVIESALLFEEAENRRLTETMTVRVGKTDYRLPVRDEKGNLAPWRVGMKLSVIVPHELDEIFVTLPNNQEYSVDKVIATADAAGEFKTLPQSQTEARTKELKAHHAANNKAAKEKRATTGEVYQIPHFNHEIAIPETNIRHFPHPEIAVTAEQLAEAVPVPIAGNAGDSPATDAKRRENVAYTGRPVIYWQAVSEYSDRFATKDEAKNFLLTLFPDREGELPETEVVAAIDRYFSPNEEVLRLVG